MRRLALMGLLAAMVLSSAVPAAAVPIDPGRLSVQVPAMTSTSTDATVLASFGARDQLTLLSTPASELGDRPADGLLSSRLVSSSDLSVDTSFNRAAIGAGSG